MQNYCVNFIEQLNKLPQKLNKEIFQTKNFKIKVVQIFLRLLKKSLL